MAWNTTLRTPDLQAPQVATAASTAGRTGCRRIASQEVTEALYRFAEVDCVAFASQSSDGSETLFADTAIRPVIVDWVACWISLQQVLLCALVRLHLNIQTAASADLDAAFAAICRVFNHPRVGASDVDVFRDRHSILPRCASE